MNKPKPPVAISIYWCATCGRSKLYPLGRWHRDEAGFPCRDAQLEVLAYSLNREEVRRVDAVAQFLKAAE